MKNPFAPPSAPVTNASKSAAAKAATLKAEAASKVTEVNDSHDAHKNAEKAHRAAAIANALAGNATRASIHRASAQAHLAHNAKRDNGKFK